MQNEEKFRIRQETRLRNTLIGMKNGFLEGLRHPWIFLLLIPVYAAILYVLHKPLADFPTLKDLLWLPGLFLAVIGTGACLWVIGRPLQAKRVMNEFSRIGLVNDADEPPLLLSVRKDPKKQEDPGVSLRRQRRFAD